MINRVAVEVIRHSLIYSAEEMGVALRKSAYSPNIRERADHSCAVTDELGRTVGQAEHIPVHLGSLPLGIKNILGYLEKEGIELKEGDMIVVNDPYIAETHLNDVTLLRPVFYGGRLIAYVANKAHQVDVGGTSPASISHTATEIFQEGLILPPCHIMRRNILQGDVVKIMAFNSRSPESTVGDLRAQVAANLLGDRLVREVIERYGAETFRQACELIMDSTENISKNEYASMAHGEFEAEDYIELDKKLIPIRVKVNVSEDGVEADFSGTSPQVESPVNAVLGVTTAAVTFAVRSLIRREIELNDGFYRTVKVSAPEGSLVNPVKPAPVAAGNLETSQRIVDTVFKALIEAMPDRIPAASHGSMNNLMIGGVHPSTGRTWAFYETIGGGSGGRPGKDGIDGVHVNMTNTMNTPIEVMERYYPIRFISYKFRERSCGHGRWRGGCGIERALVALERMRVGLVGERGRTAPWGVKGGLEGARTEYLIVRADGRVERLPTKTTATLEKGDKLYVRTAGGGGYGDPREREWRLVARDLADGLISEEDAAEIYCIPRAELEKLLRELN